MAMTLPHILVVSTPVYGHVMPLRAIARALIQHSYTVTFLTGSDFRDAITSIGASFVALSGEADLTQEMVERGWRGVERGDPAGLRMGEGAGEYWGDVIGTQFGGVQRALAGIHDGLKVGEERKVVIVAESWFKGVLPKMLGAGSELDVVGYVGVGIIPVAVSSVDTAPFGEGILPDSSREGRERNAKLNYVDQVVIFGEAQRRFKEALKKLGARDRDLFVRDAIYHLVDRFVQMCTPSFEYPRSDAPETIVFAGGLPVGLRDPSPKFPEWWGDVTGKGEKKVVFVAQGTVSMDPNDLIIPTMLAFKERSDVIVVVALGKKGITLPSGTVVPENARVADFLPYDEILEFTDCFVSNGGYGAIQHGLGHGVPQIVAGVDADKAENCARLGWSGVGLNLRTDKPSADMIEKSVTQVLLDEKYKKRAKEIQAEMSTYDPIGVILESINTVTKGKP